MKQKLFWILAGLLALSLTGCSMLKPAPQNGQTSEIVLLQGEEQLPQEDQPPAAVKSDGYEKFAQLEMGMTEAEVNAIMGEPTKVDKAYYYYTILVNGMECEAEVWINTVSGTVIYKNGPFFKEEYRAEFADSATDLSAVDRMEAGEITTYDECVEAFHTPGYLITLDEDGKASYLWVTADDGYISIYFGADGTGLC